MTSATSAPQVVASLAASGDAGSSTWMSYGFLILFAVLLVGFFVWLRPRMREQRRRAWEKAGLLPEQLDPDGVERTARERRTDAERDV
ncbi:hypothetical protein [Luteipulveratus mongoliensis]|uniref:Uncharacterized protein n=1 Tax=Luteipulveratus mongoliensis TaxID=571913 RepID=A0A0K1JHT8_9MICO|nr:hypothetical protein [Luteipulveratus mongoliensis]AKU16158.1 hypothetical protein VV02_10275 [Luteipulveratus mongoliensis]